MECRTTLLILICLVLTSREPSLKLHILHALYFISDNNSIISIVVRVGEDFEVV